MFLPNRLNEALMPMPLTAYERHMAKAAKDFQKLQKVAEAGDPTPQQRSETIGKLLQSGMLRGGATNDLAKRAESRRIRFDDPEKARLNKQVGAALARQPGHSLGGALSKIGVGSDVRKMVADNNANLLPLNARYLPGQEGPSISEGAIEVMNSLPDARVRQSVVNVLLSRPPLSNNDRYVWLQSIITLRDQINEMTAAMGLDPSALIDTLDRRAEFYDPMVQDRASRPTSPASSVSPNIEDPASFFDVPAPDEPMAVNPNFAGSDRTDLQPDFRGQKLAKFYKVGRDLGRDTCQTPTQREQLEQYAQMLLRSDFPPDLRKHILTIHEGRNRAGEAEWARVQKTPVYKAIINAIHTMRGLTPQMKGACMALVSSRSVPPAFYMPE